MTEASIAAAKPVSRLSWPERLNFLITNRIPRRWATLFVGRISRIEHRFVANLLISVWRLFVDDLRLEEARKQEFTSLRDCFTRELKDGARPIDKDPTIITSPCDAIVGEFGSTRGFEAIQAKGFPYSIVELLGSPEKAEKYRNSRFVTLRLKSSMYHRFHAPCDATTHDVVYISGDTWNVNPIALKSIERLFCKNERAVISLTPRQLDAEITLVPIAAILVASMQLKGLQEPLNLEYQGPNSINWQHKVMKGEQLGYFQQGSTIVMFATGPLRFVEDLRIGATIRMGEPLMRYTNLISEQGHKNEGTD